MNRYTAHDTPNATFPPHLVEEADDLSSHVLASCLLVVHNTSGSCENNVAELTRWQELDNPLLKICQANVVSWGDDTSLVEAAIQLDDDFSRSVVIDLLEFSDIAVLLHDAEELNDDLGAWSDENLALSRLLGVVDGIERIVED